MDQKLRSNEIRRSEAILLRTMQPIRRRDAGASLVEYALLVALIAIACLLAVTVLGEDVSKSFSSTANSVAGA